MIIRTLVCDDDFQDDSGEANSPFYKDVYLFILYSIKERIVPADPGAIAERIIKDAPTYLRRYEADLQDAAA